MWTDVRIIHITRYRGSFLLYLLPKHIDPLMSRPYGKTAAADNQWWSIFKPTIYVPATHPYHASTSRPVIQLTLSHIHLHLCTSLKQNAKFAPLSAPPSPIPAVHTVLCSVHADTLSAVTGELVCTNAWGQNIRHIIKHNFHRCHHEKCTRWCVCHPLTPSKTHQNSPPGKLTVLTSCMCSGRTQTDPVSHWWNKAATEKRIQACKPVNGWPLKYCQFMQHCIIYKYHYPCITMYVPCF